MKSASRSNCIDHCVGHGRRACRRIPSLESDSLAPPAGEPDSAHEVVARTGCGGAQAPRERLRWHGASVLCDAELLALLLRTGSRGVDALELARGLLQESGGLPGLRRYSLGQLCRVRGLGPAKAGALMAAVEVGRRLASRRLRPGDAIRSPKDVYRHFDSRLRDQRKERFIALLLDGRHRVTSEMQVSEGTLTASLVHPREVFGPAVRAAAAAIVLVHNHPSGDPEPSGEDREVTERLISAGELLGIRVLDHVVVAERGYFSFREHGELPMP